MASSTPAPPILNLEYTFQVLLGFVCKCGQVSLQ